MTQPADNVTVSDADEVEPVKRRVPRWVITTASIVVLLLLWEYFGRDINPIFGSYPSAIFAAFLDLVRNGKLGAALMQSIQPFILGYVAAIIIGVPLGL